MNNTFKKYSINSCLEKAHFLAQVIHESGNFKYKKEIWGPTETQKKYEGRSDLGNTEKGDGEKFLGRGFIQLTGRFNYLKYSKFIGLDFTLNSNYKKLEENPYNIDSAGWYWTKYLNINLNELAKNNDLLYITYLINGGFNGLLDGVNKGRKSIFKDVMNHFKCKNINSKIFDFNVKESKIWEFHDAIFQYANLLTDQSKSCFKNYLELTKDYLMWNSIKDWKTNSLQNDKKIKIENRRKIAQTKI